MEYKSPLGRIIGISWHEKMAIEPVRTRKDARALVVVKPNLT